jgi:hypothetical protein
MYFLRFGPDDGMIGYSIAGATLLLASTANVDQGRIPIRALRADARFHERRINTCLRFERADANRDQLIPYTTTASPPATRSSVGCS